ncbi:MAG TPA: hypothetical protein VMW53_07710 [archaeon]|nr:hypothetical protein [archaeon]
MNIKLFINCKITDKHGNVVSEEEQRANSLVKAFAASLRAQYSTSATASISDTAGSSRSLTAAVVACTAAAGTVTDGIVIGTGTDAVTISDYQLKTRIAHGAGAGEMEYGTQTFDASVTVSGSDCYFQMARVFTNNSGDTITVKEVGIYSSIGSYDFLLDRTLIDQAVTNGQTLTLQYKFQISV